MGARRAGDRARPRPDGQSGGRRTGLEGREEAGFRTEDPPEEWLYKAWDGEILVDIIFEPSGGPVDAAMFERAEELDVHAVTMRSWRSRT